MMIKQWYVQMREAKITGKNGRLTPVGLRIHPQGTASENRRKTSFCFFHKPVSPFASRLQTKDYHTGIAFAANVGLWKRRRISPAGFKDEQLRVAGRISVVSWVPCHETPSPRLRATRISVPRERGLRRSSLALVA